MQPIKPLSGRELEIARAVGAGHSYARIGRDFGIATRTVRAHVAAIAMKLPPAAGILPSYRRVMLWAAEHCRTT